MRDRMSDEVSFETSFGTLTKTLSQFPRTFTLMPEFWKTFRMLPVRMRIMRVRTGLLFTTISGKSFMMKVLYLDSSMPFSASDSAPASAGAFPTAAVSVSACPSMTDAVSSFEAA